MFDSQKQQLTFLAPYNFEWREVPTPRISTPSQAIVHALAVTRCDLGDQVSNFKIGDKVVVPFQINCGSCDNCQRGFINACSSVPAYSAYGLAPSSGQDWGGGLSDFVRVPFADAMLVEIPQDVPLITAAAISDNASDGYRAVALPLIERPGG